MHEDKLLNNDESPLAKILPFDRSREVAPGSFPPRFTPEL